MCCTFAIMTSCNDSTGSMGDATDPVDVVTETPSYDDGTGSTSGDLDTFNESSNMDSINPGQP